MRVFLIRHGKASPAEDWRGADRDRPLKPRGERQARWLAEQIGARPESERPSIILSSPYRRAIDTARVLHEAWGCELREDRTLEPPHDADEVDALLAEHQAAEPGVLALVGHNPLLEDVLDTLVRGLRGEAGEMRTGEAVEVDYDGPGRSRLIGRLRLDD
jgi:phosphohistidine phosphatase